jgi:hypothetical protein
MLRKIRNRIQLAEDRNLLRALYTHTKFNLWTSQKALLRVTTV